MKPGKKNKIVIFDMDGVLFDTIPFARQEFMKMHPGVTEEMYDAMHAGNYHDKAKAYSHLKITKTPDETTKRLQEYSTKKSASSLFDGMKELLTQLHRDGFTLVLNTNAYDKNSFPLLDSAGIRPLFGMIATADVSPDKVEKFRMIEKTYDVDKKDIVFITDALGDVRDAGKAGIATIAVTWGVHGEQHLRKEDNPNLVHIVDSVEKLKSAIKSWF